MRAAQPIGCAAFILRASQEYPSSVQIRSQAGIENWRFMFDHHELVVSNGLLTESLFTGPEAVKTIPGETWGEQLGAVCE